MICSKPRLDIISSQPANYQITSAEQPQQTSRHSRHTHGNRHHHQQRSSEESEEISENKLHHHSNRDHSHRGNSNVEET
jgi:hypothetical protein